MKGNQHNTGDMDDNCTGARAVKAVTLPPADLVLTEGDNAVDVLQLRTWPGQRRRFIAGVTALAAVAALAYVLLAPAWYRAEVVLAPTGTASNQSGLAGSLGALGGLGSLVGLSNLSLGGGGTAESIAVLTSTEFTWDLISNQRLVPVLFADDWDAQHGRWKQPQLAARWANVLNARLNARVRGRRLEEADAKVGYLRRDLNGTGVVALQPAVGWLLETAMQKAMVASVSKDAAIRVIDPARTPMYRFRPKRLQIVAPANCLQSDLASLALQATQGGGPGGQSATQAVQVGQSLLEGLRDTEPVERLAIDLYAIMASEKGSPEEIKLKDGDRLLVPAKMQQVTVLGEVRSSASHLWRPDLTRDQYVHLSGGPTQKAYRGRIDVVRANGGVVAGSGNA